MVAAVSFLFSGTGKLSRQNQNEVGRYVGDGYRTTVRNLTDLTLTSRVYWMFVGCINGVVGGCPHTPDHAALTIVGPVHQSLRLTRWKPSERVTLTPFGQIRPLCHFYLVLFLPILQWAGGLDHGDSNRTNAFQGTPWGIASTSMMGATASGQIVRSDASSSARAIVSKIRQIYA
jgi:hypothetical protein